MYRPTLCATCSASLLLKRATLLSSLSEKSARPRNVNPPDGRRMIGCCMTSTAHFDPILRISMGLPFAQISLWLGRRPLAQPDLLAAWP